MTESSKSKLWWFAGLFLRLLLVSFLGLILLFVVERIFMDLGLSSRVSFWLMSIGIVAGFAWAIYYEFPFFQSRTSRHRLFISAVIAVPTVFLTYFCIMAVVFSLIDFASKSDRRTESVTLPSGKVLENHTYYESGWDGGDRYNKLFLKNPVKRTSELVGDLNYEAGPDTPSLFAQSSHPQEFTCRNKKVLVIGSYIPKWEKNPMRAGKLIRVEKDSKYSLDGKPCTIYSFNWETKDRTPSLHQLQVLVREEDGKSTILDFWNFGW